jgi:hypothetical protein
MAEHELHGVSPSYEALCQAVAGSEAVRGLLDRLPRGKRRPNLLLAGVRFLGGPVDDPAAFLDFVTARWDAVAATMMTHSTQTNEPGRCATLLPVLASLPQPLDVVAADPPRIDKGDLLLDLPRLLADAPAGATLVVFHSAVLAYLDRDQRARFTDVMHQLKRTRDVHRVSNEAPGVIPGADLVPRPHGRFILAHDQVPVATTGPHGHSLEWLPASPPGQSFGDLA